MHTAAGGWNTDAGKTSRLYQFRGWDVISTSRWSRRDPSCQVTRGSGSRRRKAARSTPHSSVTEKVAPSKTHLWSYLFKAELSTLSGAMNWLRRSCRTNTGMSYIMWLPPTMSLCFWNSAFVCRIMMFEKLWKRWFELRVDFGGSGFFCGFWRKLTLVFARWLLVALCNCHILRLLLE